MGSRGATSSINKTITTSGVRINLNEDYQTYQRLEGTNRYTFQGWYKIPSKENMIDEKVRTQGNTKYLYRRYKTKSGEVQEYRYKL